MAEVEHAQRRQVGDAVERGDLRMADAELDQIAQDGELAQVVDCARSVGASPEARRIEGGAAKLEP